MGVAGVEAQHHLALEGGLHEEVGEVIREDLDGTLAGVVKEVVADLSLDGGGDEAGIAVGDGITDVGGGGGLGGGQDAVVEEAQHHLLGNGEADLQKLLLLAAVDGQDAVAGELFDGLGEVVVHGVDRILLLRGLGGQRAVVEGKGAELLAVLGVVGHVLRDDVHGTLEGLFHSIDLLLGVNEAFRLHLDGGGVGLLLGQQKLRQRLQSPLTGNRGAGLSLGAEGAVDIVHLGDGHGTVDGGHDLGGQLALGVDEVLDLLLALFQIAQGGQTLLQSTEDSIVQATRDLLAVTGDEGDGIALVDEGDGLFDLVYGEVEFFGEGFDDGHKMGVLLDVLVCPMADGWSAVRED